MTALALTLSVVVLAGAPDGGSDAPRGQVDVLKALAGFRGGQGHAGITVCASCHITASWTDVRFNHERTGFSLTGKHARASCKSCHVTDFSVPLTRTCQGCHRDVHAGELGARCESCHETNDWRSRFDADAHRRTNFPLIGGHAALPCVECHAEARERRFSRSTVNCEACHQRNLTRTVANVLDHLDPASPELTVNCGSCHSAVRFSPATYDGHDGCFPISAGPHAGLSCVTCHTVPTRKSLRSCNTNTAANCTDCHGRERTDELHLEVRQYSWAEKTKVCAQCHRGGGP